jgi:Na+/melibiose symporter-like transporter
MAVTNLLMAAALLPLLAVQDAGRAWIVYAVIAAQSCLAPFCTAAGAALVPTVVPADHLVTVNSLNAQARDVARLVGAALGGIIAGFGGVALLSIVDAAALLLAAGLIAGVRTRPVATRTERPHVLQEWAAGLRIATHGRALRVFLAFALTTGVGEAILGTLAAPFVRDVLGGDARAYGIIMAAQAVGGIAGGLLATMTGHRFTPRAMYGWGAVTFGGVDLVLFLYPLLNRAVWPAVGLIALAGIPVAFLAAGAMTVFQRATEDHHRARVWGAMLVVDGVAMLLGTIAAGTLADRIGILPVITVQGVVYAGAGVLVLLALPREAPVRPSAAPLRAELPVG